MLSTPSSQADSPIPPPVDVLFSPRRAAEHQRLLAAQQQLERRRIQNQQQLQETRAFEAALRSSVQPLLLARTQGSGGAAATESQGDAPKVTGQAPSHLQRLKRVPAPQSFLRPSGTSGEQVAHDSPAQLAQQALPEAERIMRERLWHLAQAKREASGKPGQAQAVRCDRMTRNLTVLGVLSEAAYVIVQARGQQARHVTSYVYFTVLDTLTIATGLSVSSCEKAVTDLRACGLIATRSEWTNAEFKDERGQPCIKRAKTGVWLGIELRPREDRRAMIFSSELPAEPQRDLAADRKARTHRLASPQGSEGIVSF